MHKINDWEKAICRRADVQFNEIYLKDGVVDTVIGVVLVPTRMVRGQIKHRWRKVRWDKYGICLNANGTEGAMLYQYNIHFDQG
ncbi:MAG: hypothetical protein IJT30_04655 [Muribaculaceae bacterium]|nr:hypothetical protein [Muribaculaceae bacterium]